MVRALRVNVVAIAFAALGLVALGWVGLTGFAWNDYDFEASAAVAALVHGHLSRSLGRHPARAGGRLEVLGTRKHVLGTEVPNDESARASLCAQRFPCAQRFHWVHWVPCQGQRNLRAGPRQLALRRPA